MKRRRGNAKSRHEKAMASLQTYSSHVQIMARRAPIIVKASGASAQNTNTGIQPTSMSRNRMHIVLNIATPEISIWPKISA